MLQQEKEQSTDMPLINLEDIMPINNYESNYASIAHPDDGRKVDKTDPSIFGNEFEVPQEKTLNTEDFTFTGLPAGS